MLILEVLEYIFIHIRYL